MKILPKARTADIVVQNLQTEVLIYDLKLDKAFCLNETSAKVFNRCDGKTNFDELKRRYKFTDDLIHLAIAELKANDLLEEYQSDYFAGLSRREAIKRAGLASMIALPVIVGLSAPTAANAASNSCAQTDQSCTFNNGAQSGCCDTLRCAAFGRCVACTPRGELVGPQLTAFCCSGTATLVGPANIYARCD